jgi:uncharacterized membrane protein
MRIVAFEPNRLWAEHLEGAGIEGQLTLRFAEQGEATRIVVEVSLELPGPLRLAGPLIRALFLPAIRQDLARVEQLV